VQLIERFRDVEVLDFRLVPAGDRVGRALHTRAKGERVDLEVEQRARTPSPSATQGSPTGGSTRPGRALTDAGLDPGLASAGSRSGI